MMPRILDFLLGRARERKPEREKFRLQVRKRLKKALHKLVPGERIFLYGPVTRPSALHPTSDVNIAFVREPPGYSLDELKARLEKMIKHPVHLVVLWHPRQRRRIEHQGEAWTT
jgi:predicted nucleotidyltransferase